ncbi:MAG: mannose-1-phosphate guanylyltransferase [Lentisphaerae bacterium]|nr:mannose-1-phosphate guanylyltransferase [Lentisphaerota bacterium]
MSKKVYAVIMAGGRGERFWPLSTAERPKQFLTLFGGKTLLAQAVERLEGVIPTERILVITSADLVELTRSEAPALLPDNVIGEPCGRDTAAACALACALVERRDPDGVVCILTADQIMRDVVAFRRTLSDAAVVAATHDVIVTLGIVPTSPATGFGYIRAVGEFTAPTATPFLEVESFVEKPDLATAERYLAEGGYFWNAGMFIWRTSVMHRALAKFTPVLEAMYRRLVEAPAGTAAELAIINEIYPGLERISVDYAVMEHSTNLVVARSDFGWDDVGTWGSAADHLPVCESGNALVGKCFTLDATNNVVVAADGGEVALLGVEGLVVVQHKGKTLVCSKDRAQDIKKLLQVRERLL